MYLFTDIAEIIMPDNRIKNTQFSSFADTSWFDGKGKKIPFNHSHDHWPSDLPSRTNIDDIDSYENIVVLVGDSFIYGDGVGSHQTIDYWLNKLSGDTKFINLGQPGASNTYTVKMLNQWFNSEYAKKTKAVVFNLAPLNRFFSTISASYMNYTDGYNRYNIDSPILYDNTYENKAFCFNQTIENPVTEETNMGNIDQKQVLRKAQREYMSYFAEWATPLNSLIECENYFVQMYWMCRGLDIPFYYLLNDPILDTVYSAEDLSWFHENLVKLEKKSKLKRVDLSGSIDSVWNKKSNFDVSDIFLSCGHWTPSANQIIAGQLLTEYTNDK